jgi:ATP-dependent helicase Lhr and Lhr-like helicase
LRRKESLSVRPEVYADFLLERLGISPKATAEPAAAVERVLLDLQGYAATLTSWETDLLPRRVKDFQSRWLDEVFASGAWTWRARGEEQGDPRVAFVPRDFAGSWPAEQDPLVPEGDQALVFDLLRDHGADFVTDLARSSGLEPSRVRRALNRLSCLGLITNDRLEPLRPSSQARIEALAPRKPELARTPSLGQPRSGRRRLANLPAEGRWSTLESPPGDEASLLAWAEVLLGRYGVLTRETVALDPWAPAWRDLAPLLARSELRGELRRGYFVEGLSGVQYATQEAADRLAELAGDSAGRNEPVLISTIDPANLYGSGAPLDIALLEGGTARLVRSAANLLVLIAGRPVLIIEGHGKRLTGLASASESELRAALGLLSTLAGPSRRVLRVETFNEQPVLASPVAPSLIELGFVRDLPGLTFYAGW